VQAAVSAAGMAVVGTLVLAKEILDAGERVVANHARCLRLTARIHSIVPLLSCFHTHHTTWTGASPSQCRTAMLHCNVA
jgi:hypothetical protein